MRILGIDPGSNRCGWGCIEKKGGKIIYIDAGLIETKHSQNNKFLFIGQEYKKIIIKTQPDIISIEKIFFAKNVKTAIEVAQARGVILYESLLYNIAIVEYNPMQVKQAVTTYGLADKKAVAKMVSMILAIPQLKMIDDTSDALAIALAACNYNYLKK